MNQLKYIIAATNLLMSFSNQAQGGKDSELYNTLKSNDSLLFEVGFNQCNLNKFEDLMAKDLEFYHDKSGATNSLSNFLEALKTGICNPSNTFKARRELIKGSLEVYPLYNNGILYGAIQTGEHRFFEKQENQQEKAGSVAKFTHLWILDNNQWKLKRILSYNHQSLTSIIN